jgi:hypothetical protein
MSADVLADGGLRTRRRPCGLRLAHAAERERAGRGEAAGHDTGAAQEGAAIETTARVSGERGGK